MIKARFSQEQEPARVLRKGGVVYAFICLNGTQKTEEKKDGSEETGEETREETHYEYDYNEFSGTDLDESHIMAHPEEYLDYSVKKKATEERIAELEKQNEMLTQCLLEMSELVYQ